MHGPGRGNFHHGPPHGGPPHGPHGPHGPPHHGGPPHGPHGPPVTVNQAIGGQGKRHKDNSCCTIF